MQVGLRSAGSARQPKGSAYRLFDHCYGHWFQHALLRPFDDAVPQE